jgi:hypothetical protein
MCGLQIKEILNHNKFACTFECAEYDECTNLLNLNRIRNGYCKKYRKACDYSCEALTIGGEWRLLQL